MEDLLNVISLSSSEDESSDQVKKKSTIFTHDFKIKFDTIFSNHEYMSQKFPYLLFIELLNCIKHFMHNPKFPISAKTCFWRSFLDKIYKPSLVSQYKIHKDIKFNRVLGAIMAEYLNFRCEILKLEIEKYPNAETARQLNGHVKDLCQKLGTTLLHIFNGNKDFVTFALLQVKPDKHYQLLLSSLFSNILSYYNKVTMVDHITYVRLILCFRRWKTLVSHATMKKTINEISRRVLPQNMSGRGSSETRDFLQILPKHKKDKENATNFLINHKLLEGGLLDKAINRYFDAHEEHATILKIPRAINMNTTLAAFIIENSTVTAVAVVTLATTSTIVPLTTSGPSIDTELFVATSLSLVSPKHTKHHDDVSPVTLSSEWSRMARLLLLSCLSVIGSIGNVFMISSVMIQDHLKKAGNSFIVNIALADLVITSVLIPASTVVLLAGTDDSLPVWKFQWFLAACSVLVTVLSLAITAIENYLRLCTQREWFNKTNITVILLTVWFIGGISSGLQFMFNISFDYCTRKSNGIIPYQAVVVALLILLPLLLTFYAHVRIIIDVKRLMREPHFKPNLNYQSDLSLIRTNFYSFLIFVLFWLPFGIVLAYGTTKVIPDRIFYNTAWIGLTKSGFHNVIYCISNRHFRSAYISLFHYCCCKTTVSTARRQRNDGHRPTADVRVHIIPGYNMYSYTSPQRSGNSHHGHWSKRDVHEL